MRKKIIGFTFLISFCFFGLLCYFSNKPKVDEIYNLESEVLSVESTINEQIPYKVNHYYETLDGEYDVSVETLYGDLDELITVTPKLKSGFIFDSDNLNNAISGQLKEGLELKVYYKRRTYKVSYINNSPYGNFYSEDDVLLTEFSTTLKYGEKIYSDGQYLILGKQKIYTSADSLENVQYKYNFEGWDFSDLDSKLVPDENGIYTINIDNTISDFKVYCSFTQALKKYKVTWMNEDAIIEIDENVEYGETPEYNGIIPAKPEDVQYKYDFNGWSPEISPVTGDVIYSAQYTKTLRKYKVTFEIPVDQISYGSLTRYELDVDYGTIFSLDKENPKKIYIGNETIFANTTNNTAKFEFLFSSWELSEGLIDGYIITGDITVYAKFSRLDKVYTVYWYNQDGSLIDAYYNIKYGTKVEYTGKEPVMAPNEQYSYIFTGWSKKIITVTSDIKVFALYDKVVNKYTVTWVDSSGNILEQDEVEYGSKPEYNGETPVEKSFEDYFFVFEEWYNKTDGKNEIIEVKKDTVYQPVFSKWYLRNVAPNDNRFEIHSTGLRNDIMFKAEEVYGIRLFTLPKDFEAIIVVKASLTKENANYVHESPLKIAVDLGDDFEENREYKVRMNVNGEIKELDVVIEDNIIYFETNQVGDFVVFAEIIKHINLIWLIVLLSVLIVAEVAVFYFIVVKKYKEYSRKIELGKLNSNALLGLLLIIRITPVGHIVFTIILGVILLAATGFLIYCFLILEKMKKELPDEGEDFIYIPVHEEEELEIETCPVYTGPKRDMNKAPRQTYYDTPYRPIYYYQPIPIYQQGVVNMEIDDDVNDDEIIIEDGEIVRIHYKRSFMSRIIQGTKEIQDFYTRLRNEISSYPKLKSRVGWEHESIYTSRETIVLIKVKGDMLCVFLALDPSKFNKSKMEFGDVGKIKKYKNVPMLIKIKEEKDLENVLKLLDQICKKNKLLKEEIGNEDYHYEFRTDKELIEEGLIKEVKTYSGKLEQPEEEILTEDMIRSEINVTEAKEALTDEQALSLIETIEVEDNKSAGTKKTIVNIGTLSRFYEANEVVDLSSLKTKKIVSKDTGYVKILASGVLDKPLVVVANSYSIDAVKMILLTGGKVTKI